MSDSRPALIVDAHSPGPAGLGRYTRQMVTALAAREDFRAIYLAGNPEEMESWRQDAIAAATSIHIIPFNHRRHSPLVPVNWPAAAAKVRGSTVTWFPHFDGAWTASPSVTTLHDIIHLADKSLRGRARALIITQWVQRMIAGSSALITGSAGSATRIAEEFPESRTKLNVVPHGVAEIFHSAGRGELDAWTPSEAGVPARGARYLLTVASKRPHKRLETAVRAFARLSAEDANLRLVMVGSRDDHAGALKQLAQQLGVAGRVDDLANVSDKALAYTYRNAEALLVPSREEGFGLVLIEAMATGTPVIVVDAPPLPEVAGGAAVVVRLADDEAMAHAVRTLDRSGLREAGLKRAAEFTWARAAEQTAHILLKSEEQGARGRTRGSRERDEG